MTARLTMHVQPRAKQTAITGRHGDAIRIRLAAPPVDGAANEELIRFVAEMLAVPKRSVRIVAGATARRKVIEIDGIATADAETRLA